MTHPTSFADTATSGASEFKRGWPTLVAATIGVGLGSTGLPFYSFGQLVRPLAAEFHWSRGEIAGGVTCLMLGMIIVSPFAGRLIDRFGPRRVALWSLAGLALGFLLLSFINASVLTYYAAWLLLSLMAGGTSPISWSRAVAGWFDRSRGLALGIMLCGTGVAALLSPIFVNEAIASFGWRSALRLLAVAALVGIPITYLLLRDNQAARPQTGTSAAALPGMAVEATLRSSQFWRIVAAIFLISIVVGGLIVHMPAMIVDRGYTAASAAGIVSTLGYAVIVGRLALGFLMDRVPPAAAAAGFVALSAVASLLLANNVSPLPCVLLLGLCAGAEVDMLAFLMSRLFGLRHFAQIYGFGISAFTAGAALGPILAGMVHDRIGHYDLALYAFAALTIVASALILSLGPALRTKEDRVIAAA